MRVMKETCVGLKCFEIRLGRVTCFIEELGNDFKEY